MNKELISVVVRAILQALAGALTVRGITVDNGSLELISGGLVAVFTVLWSLKEKAKIKADR